MHRITGHRQENRKNQLQGGELKEAPSLGWSESYEDAIEIKKDLKITGGNQFPFYRAGERHSSASSSMQRFWGRGELIMFSSFSLPIGFIILSYLTSFSLLVCWLVAAQDGSLRLGNLSSSAQG